MQWKGELVCFLGGEGERERAGEGRRGDRGSSRHIHQLVLRAPACQTWQRADALLHTQAKHLACEKVLAGLASLARTLFFVSAVLSPQMKKKGNHCGAGERRGRAGNVDYPPESNYMSGWI